MRRITPDQQAAPLAAAPDREYSTRLDAERSTHELRTKSARTLDRGQEPITDSPLFGGPAQGSLFDS